MFTTKTKFFHEFNLHTYFEMNVLSGNKTHDVKTGHDDVEKMDDFLNTLHLRSQKSTIKNLSIRTQTLIHWSGSTGRVKESKEEDIKKRRVYHIILTLHQQAKDDRKQFNNINSSKNAQPRLSHDSHHINNQDGGIKIIIIRKKFHKMRHRSSPMRDWC